MNKYLTWLLTLVSLTIGTSLPAKAKEIKLPEEKKVELPNQEIIFPQFIREEINGIKIPQIEKISLEQNLDYLRKSPPFIPPSYEENQKKGKFLKENIFPLKFPTIKQIYKELSQEKRGTISENLENQKKYLDKFSSEKNEFIFLNEAKFEISKDFALSWKIGGLEITSKSAPGLEYTLLNWTGKGDFIGKELYFEEKPVIEFFKSAFDFENYEDYLRIEGFNTHSMSYNGWKINDLEKFFQQIAKLGEIKVEIENGKIKANKRFEGDIKSNHNFLINSTFDYQINPWEKRKIKISQGLYSRSDFETNAYLQIEGSYTPGTDLERIAASWVTDFLDALGGYNPNLPDTKIKLKFGYDAEGEWDVGRFFQVNYIFPGGFFIGGGIDTAYFEILKEKFSFSTNDQFKSEEGTLKLKYNYKQIQNKDRGFRNRYYLQSRNNQEILWFDIIAGIDQRMFLRKIKETYSNFNYKLDLTSPIEDTLSNIPIIKEGKLVDEKYIEEYQTAFSTTIGTQISGIEKIIDPFISMHNQPELGYALGFYSGNKLYSGRLEYNSDKERFILDTIFNLVGKTSDVKSYLKEKDMLILGIHPMKYAQIDLTKKEFYSKLEGINLEFHLENNFIGGGINGGKKKFFGALDYLRGPKNLNVIDLQIGHPFLNIELNYGEGKDEEKETNSIEYKIGISGNYPKELFIRLNYFILPGENEHGFMITFDPSKYLFN